MGALCGKAAGPTSWPAVHGLEDSMSYNMDMCLDRCCDVCCQGCVACFSCMCPHDCLYTSFTMCGSLFRYCFSSQDPEPSYTMPESKYRLSAEPEDQALPLKAGEWSTVEAERERERSSRQKERSVPTGCLHHHSHVPLHQFLRTTSACLCCFSFFCCGPM